MESNKRVFIQNIIAGAIVSAISAGAFVMTYYMPRRVVLFPRMGSLAMLFLGLLLVAVNVHRLRANAPTKKKPVEAAAFWNPLLTILIVAAYCAGMSILGFYVSTVLAMIGFMYFLGQRSWKTILGVTALITVIVWFFFSVQLKLPLPAGLLI